MTPALFQPRLHDLARAIANSRGLDPAGVDTILGDTASSDPRIATDERLHAGESIDAVDLLGALHESHRDRARRKRAGVYYTPQELVGPTVDRTLTPLLANMRAEEPFAICDPAVGGGAFLLAAFRHMVRHFDIPARRALASLYGVDIDPTAVRVTRLGLWLEAADPTLDPAESTARIRFGNSCLGAWSEAMVADRSDSKEARDRFCAAWFPSGDADVAGSAPPGTFHWELEFAEVFARGGFDAVIGNPPWDIAKPDSRAFFGRVDAGHAQIDKQAALARQRALLANDEHLAAQWQHELDHHARFGRWLRDAGSPFVRQRGAGDVNLYKPFVELAWRMLRHDRGRLGLLVPSGIYTDAGCASLRRMLLEESNWEWLFGFENRRGIFPIDGRFKFAVVIAQKGRRTESVQTAFMRVDAADWRDADRHALPITAETIRSASPRSLAILEITSAPTRRILERITRSTHAFGEELETSIELRRELDLTTDSHRFEPREAWEARGYAADPQSVWRPGGAMTAARADFGLPLYEGRMIDQYDFSQKGWVEGRGRRARWRDIPFGPDKSIEPQYLTAASTLTEVDPRPDLPKLGFMAIASATNRRSMVAASLFRAPCGNSVPTLRGTSVADDLCVLAVLNSFVFDFVLRTRLGGINLNRFVLAETPMLLPRLRARIAARVVPRVAELSWPHARFALAWAALAQPVPTTFRWTHEERTELRCAVEVEVARAFGLDADDLAWILRDCAHPKLALTKQTFVRALDPKAFWRVDRERDPESRLTSCVLSAFDADGARRIARRQSRVRPGH